jgi:ABC-type ATPase with predicted acetyltransferase domain
MIDPLGDDAARLLLEKMEYCADVQNGARNYRTEHVLRRAADTVRALLEERTRLREALHYADDLTKDACPRCEQCGHLVMCNFHSLLSMLSGETQP